MVFEYDVLDARECHLENHFWCISEDRWFWLSEVGLPFDSSG